MDSNGFSMGFQRIPNGILWILMDLHSLFVFFCMFLISLNSYMGFRSHLSRTHDLVSIRGGTKKYFFAHAPVENHTFQSKLRFFQIVFQTL